MEKKARVAILIPDKATLKQRLYNKETKKDQAMPLVGFYPKKTKTLTQKDISTPVFVAALFTTAKIWKQPKCPLTDDGMDKDGVHVWNITSHKTNEILPFATTRMNLENIMRSQISQTEKETHQMISLIWESKEQNK